MATGTVEHDQGRPALPPKRHPSRRRLAPLWRAAIETGFIIFLFYSNLLMGEFERANSAQGKSFAIAIRDVFTITNFGIGVVSALIGYAVFEYLRKKL